MIITAILLAGQLVRFDPEFEYNYRHLAEARTSLYKEETNKVSIRKVMGATVSEVVQLSLKEVLLMIVIAFIIASPVAYIIGKKWLQNFVLKISVNPLPFILAFVILSALVFVTVLFKERQSAMVNPIDNLRQE